MSSGRFWWRVYLGVDPHTILRFPSIIEKSILMEIEF